MTEENPSPLTDARRPSPLLETGKLLTHAGLPRFLAGPVGMMLCVRKLNNLYERLGTPIDADGENRNFYQDALRHLQVSYEVAPDEMLHLPAEGPVVVVANHPFGGLDGIILAHLLSSVRPHDARLLANYVLNAIPEMRSSIIGVDPFERATSVQTNRRGMREAFRWLQSGGMIGCFPAGEVSRWRPRRRQITDRAWSDHIAALIRRTGASVVPVYFEGRNSFLFQGLGMLHSKLRTAMLPRELFRRQGCTVRLAIGRPVPATRLAQFDRDSALTAYLRLRCYSLQGRLKSDAPSAEKPPQQVNKLLRDRNSSPKAVRLTPVADEVDPLLIQREIRALPTEAFTYRSKSEGVFVVESSACPNLILELGRLRELTFREVGEGTGKARDLDRFDDDYLHAVLWNEQDQAVMGAYRLGLTDRILPLHGPRGLYTTTLFKFAPGFLERLDPAVELGRSFITSRYQRKHSSLFALWRGVSSWIAQHPCYRYVFGPVSISGDYHVISRNLMVQFMRDQLRHGELARLVRPTHPFKMRSSFAGLKPAEISQSLRSIDEVSALVSEIEKDGKGVPVLFKQYLKLNAALLNFNVDPDFSQVVDGLMIVDLLKTDPKVLARFMGEEAVRGYRAFQESATAAA